VVLKVTQTRPFDTGKSRPVMLKCAAQTLLRLVGWQVSTLRYIGVSLHTASFAHPCAAPLCTCHGAESAGSSYATGFVVDKQRGLILTNRHVVTPGPTVAEAVFQNREELRVCPLYHDPVHDFGFFRFDPSQLQYLTVAEVPLAPEAACVGLDIRVVGEWRCALVPTFPDPTDHPALVEFCPR
jgi:S1-C subfamily serine protease